MQEIKRKHRKHNGKKKNKTAKKRTYSTPCQEKRIHHILCVTLKIYCF